MTERQIQIPIREGFLEGELTLPAHPAGVVVFAHGSGSSRHSARNQFVAKELNGTGLGTLLMDLLTESESDLRFDIGMLSDRLRRATEWLLHDPQTMTLPVGYYGASTGAAAALVASVSHPNRVRAIVSRGGRPDLAGDALADVSAKTLLVVGSLDREVIELNREALSLLRCEKELVIVPGAGHLFEEAGTLEAVANIAADWFAIHFAPSKRAYAG